MPSRDLELFESSLRENPLRRGDKDGLRVRRWRARLRSKGFVVAASGDFDARLENATKVAQAWAGVAIDGVVGPVTWNAVGRKKRSRRPVQVVRSVLGRPKVIDARNGRNGFPVHPARDWQKRTFGQVRAIVGHYTGGPASFVADARFHVLSDYLTAGGAPALAYHIGVDKDGTVFVFNEFTDVTWHCDGGRNTETVGIVFRGGAEGPTLAQKRSLRWVVSALEAGTFGYGYPKLAVYVTTHRHIKPTSCPGEPGEAFYRSIAKRWTTRL